VLAYADSAGGYGLSMRENDTFADNVYNDNVPFDAPLYSFLVIAANNVVYFYLNGNYVGSVNTAISSGGIGEAVVNFESTNTECRFTNIWVLTWD
jgi:hypothetical protein